MSAADPDPTVPRWWILVFLLLALGLAAAGVQFVGGSLVTGAILP